MSDSSAIEAAHRRIANMLGRGRITLTDDAGVIMSAQVDLGPQGASGPLYLADLVPVMGLFGHASVPPAGADCALIFLGGDRNRAAIIGHNHQASRLRGLGPGDSALYDVRGAYVKLTAGGLVTDAAGLRVAIQNASSVTITSTGPVTVNAPTVNLGGTGGAAVARVGDTVNTSTGKIISGSAKVNAT